MDFEFSPDNQEAPNVVPKGGAQCGCSGSFQAPPHRSDEDVIRSHGHQDESEVERQHDAIPLAVSQDLVVDDVEADDQALEANAEKDKLETPISLREQELKWRYACPDSRHEDGGQEEIDPRTASVHGIDFGRLVLGYKGSRESAKNALCRTSGHAHNIPKKEPNGVNRDLCESDVHANHDIIEMGSDDGCTASKQAKKTEVEDVFEFIPAPLFPNPLRKLPGLDE